MNNEKFLKGIEKGFNNQSFKEIIYDLIEDEYEAIEGYRQAIEALGDIPRLNEIMDDEREHIRELKELLANGNRE